MISDASEQRDAVGVLPPSPRTKNKRMSVQHSGELRRTLSQRLDLKGDFVTMTKREASSLMRNMEKKEKKIDRLWKLVMLSAMGIVALVAICVLSTVVANEVTGVSTGTRVADDNHMVGSNGKSVEVTAVRSYGDIFDLPRFSARTLASITHISLNLKDGSNKFEATFGVASVLKSKSKNAITLLTSDGSSILIDRDAAVATVEISGKRYFADGGDEGNKRRRAQQAGEPRLYSADEFFVPENGFKVTLEGNMRRLAAQWSAGFAALSVAAGEELLDHYNDASGNGAQYTSIYFSGSIAAGDKTYPAKVYFTSDESAFAGSRISITDGARTEITDYGLNFLYRKTGSTVDSCLPLSSSNLADYKKALSAIKSVDVTMGGAVVRISTTSGDGFVYIHGPSVVLDAPADSLPLPTDDECRAAHAMTSSDDSRRELGDAKRMLDADELTPRQLWNLAFASYKGEKAPSGFTREKAFEKDNTHAVAFSYNAGGQTRYVLGFAGTSGPTDFGDWGDNLNRDKATLGKRTIHKGFLEYVERVDGEIQTWLDDKTLSYVVGHSLGGAAATVYSVKYGGDDHKVATHGVATFGAPKTSHDKSCSVPGTRWAHENDPVASNVMGMFSALKHDVENSKKMVIADAGCTRNCWFTCCPFSRAEKKKVEAQKTCSWTVGICASGWGIVNCGRYFASVHGDYGAYL